MTKIIQSAVRWMLAAFLLYGVYGETGKWTTTALALLFIEAELINYMFLPIYRHFNHLKSVKEESHD